MARLRVHAFSVSLDGYGAGARQSASDPLGAGGERLHDWLLPTRTVHEMMRGETGGETGVDNDLAAAGFEGVGATIMGRNMFGPVRGAWPDESWIGWWGDNPPFHHPVFVLTHHARPPLTMAGGTSFHFVTDGIHATLDRAIQAAGGQDVRLGGGVSTIQQYLQAGLVNHLHVAIVPILLGAGERLFDGIADISDAYDAKLSASHAAAHVVLTRRTPPRH